MAKTSSGCPYSKPTTKPTYIFVRDAITMEVYYNVHNTVEIFQVHNGHTQRIVMPHSEYENFESLIKTNGFITRR
jgi:hypothetical protein